jgi:hypothetical protein
LDLRVRLMLSSLNPCLIITSIFIALFRDLHKILSCSIVRSIAKSHEARYMTAKKKSAHPLNCKTFCTLTPKVCYYCYPLLLHTSTTFVHMAAPILEIIDSPSYCEDGQYMHLCFWRWIWSLGTMIVTAGCIMLTQDFFYVC